MLDAGQIQSWQTNLAPEQREMWRQLVAEVGHLKKEKTPTKGEFGRGHGNMLARLAVMARLTGDAQLVEVARQYLLDVSGRPVWDADTDLLHGHMLWGAAIAYDWLWQDLTAEQRAAVRAKLGQEAQLQCLASSVNRGYWRNQYLQNHGHVNLCGLAFAAAALYGEDSRALQWLKLCR